MTMTMPDFGLTAPGLPTVDPLAASQQTLNNANALANYKPQASSLAGLSGLIGNTPDAPTLKTDVHATGLWDGIAQGIGNAVNNRYALNAYNQQQADRQAAIRLYQQQMAQQQQAAQAKAIQDARNLDAAVQGLPPEMQAAARQNPELIMEYFKNRIPDINAVGHATAQQQGALDALQLQQQYMQQHAPAQAVTDQYGARHINPDYINYYTQVYGKAPTTQYDTTTQEANAGKARAEALTAIGSSPYQIQKAAGDVTEQQDRHLKELTDQQYRAALNAAELAIRQAQAQGDADKVARAQSAYSDFQRMKETGDLYNPDPSVQALVAATASQFGATWKPTGTDVKTVTNKDGSTTLYTQPGNGQVYVTRIGKDGVVKGEPNVVPIQPAPPKPAPAPTPRPAASKIPAAPARPVTPMTLGRDTRAAVGNAASATEQGAQALYGYQQQNPWVPLIMRPAVDAAGQYLQGLFGGQ